MGRGHPNLTVIRMGRAHHHMQPLVPRSVTPSRCCVLRCHGFPLKELVLSRSVLVCQSTRSVLDRCQWDRPPSSCTRCWYGALTITNCYRPYAWLPAHQRVTHSPADPVSVVHSPIPLCNRALSPAAACLALYIATIDINALCLCATFTLRLCATFILCSCAVASCPADTLCQGSQAATPVSCLVQTS